MASYRNENRPDSGDLLSWIITIVLLVSPVWPIGLILLLRKLTGGSRRRASRHPYDIQREGGPVPGTQGMPAATADASGGAAACGPQPPAGQAGEPGPGQGPDRMGNCVDRDLRHRTHRIPGGGHERAASSPPWR